MNRGIFYFEIFSVNISTQDESRDIFGEIRQKCRDFRRVSKYLQKKSRKKNCLIKKISSQQASKQTYIGNFVYLFVTLNTFHLTLWFQMAILGTNGLSHNSECQNRLFPFQATKSQLKLVCGFSFIFVPSALMV